MIRRTPRATRTDTHCPYTPRFRSEPLHAGAAGYQAVLLLSFRAGAGGGDDMAAMMAGDAVGQRMLDHPGAAIGALETIAAMAAQRQRRIAPAVEEEQALLASLHGLVDVDRKRTRLNSSH